jgi:hypothetical protein
MDKTMAGNVHELRPKSGDTEKITINLATRSNDMPTR